MFLPNKIHIINQILNFYKMTTAIQIGDGTFSFIDNARINERNMLANAWAAINETESWDYMTKEPKNGYMFCNDAQYNKIRNKMHELDPVISDNHSGGSMGFTMRIMQTIARDGIDAVKEIYKVKPV